MLRRNVEFGTELIQIIQINDRCSESVILYENLYGPLNTLLFIAFGLLTTIMHCN